MNDIITEYTERREGQVRLVVLGLPIEASNHHIYTEALCHELKKRITTIPIYYLAVREKKDLEKVRQIDEGFWLISSNYLLQQSLPDTDFVIFIDTNATVLAQRGLENVMLMTEEWDHFKKICNKRRILNDYSPRTFTKIEEVTRPGKPFALFFKLWKTLMRLIQEELNKLSKNP